MPTYIRFFTCLLVLAGFCWGRSLSAQCSSFYATFSTSPQEVCNGDPVTVTAVPNGGIGPYTYHWSSTSQTTQSIVMPLNANTTIWATVTDANGCTAPLYIPLSPIFSYTFDIIPNVTTICEGGASMLCGHFGPGADQYDYVWSNGSTEYGLFIQESGTYSVTVTDPATGCTASTAEYIGITTIPPLNPQIIGPTSLCGNDFATLSVSGGPYENYFWMPNFAFTPSVDVYWPDTYTVEVRIGGCVDTATITIGSGSTLPELTGAPLPCPGLPVEYRGSGPRARRTYR